MLWSPIRLPDFKQPVTSDVATDHNEPALDVKRDESQSTETVPGDGPEST
jgi:hypothetical protein